MKQNISVTVPFYGIKKKEREEKERGGEDAAPLIQVNQNISSKQRKKNKECLMFS